MKVASHQIVLRDWLQQGDLIGGLSESVSRACGSRQTPLRLAITGRNEHGRLCEVEAVSGRSGVGKLPSIFDLRRRQRARTNAFNAVMLIPTGVDCVIGGHAGDATPAARTLASVVDTLVLHPNVVNASDINEQTENCLYAEGSLICRLMMGTVALERVRQNRVLLVTEERPDAPNVVDQTINCAEGARATLGMDIAEVMVLEEGLSMKTGFAESGRVTGQIEKMERLLDVLAAKRSSYDAIALATKITPHMDSVQMHRNYFSEGGANPWGGVEAVLTHLVSTVLDVPSAHAPTMSTEALRTESWGVVEPRKAAEIISTTYLYCVLKGLNRAPRVLVNPEPSYDPSVIAVEDISALVIPDGCVGLPTLAAVEQGVPVIAVRNNTNLMRNDLRELPFRPGQLLFADNYFAAAGMLSAMKAGVSMASLERPMQPIRIQRIGAAAPATKVQPAKVKAPRGGHKNGQANGRLNGHVNGDVVGATAT